MICALDKGHEGPCLEVEGESGTCKKTAAKWFATEADEPVYDAEVTVEVSDEDLPTVQAIIEVGDVMTPEEMATATEGELAQAYRRTYVPSTRREATEWARDYIAARERAAE
jgi:hypothetical protein